jgi:DNA-binding transcriptional ArsR family regulator
LDSQDKTSAQERYAMSLPSPIPVDLAEMIAARLRVIGDPTRIRILDLLRDEELTVTEITDRLGTSQQNASKHLGLLLQAGILARRKEGNSSIYSIADRGVYELCEQVCGGLQLQLAELTALVEGTG